MDSVVSVDAHCSPALSDSNSEVTIRSVNSMHDSSLPLKQDILNATYHSCEEPLFFGALSSSDSNFQDLDLPESESNDIDNFEPALNSDSRDIAPETTHKQDPDMQQLTNSNDNSSCDMKPDDSDLNLTCHFASLHPEVTPTFGLGMYKCKDCGIQLCNFCLYMTMKT